QRRASRFDASRHNRAARHDGAPSGAAGSTAIHRAPARADAGGPATSAKRALGGRTATGAPLASGTGNGTPHQAGAPNDAPGGSDVSGDREERAKYCWTLGDDDAHVHRAKAAAARRAGLRAPRHDARASIATSPSAAAMIRDASSPNDQVADQRRALPSVNTLLELRGMDVLLARAPRGVVTDAVRAALDAARSSNVTPGDEPGWIAAVERELSRIVRPSLRLVLNATGVVLHTNLGRAPLADVA